MPDNIDSYVNCDNKGCLLEVDFEYPKELHDLRKNIIFMCEKMKINGVGMRPSHRLRESGS